MLLRVSGLLLKLHNKMTGENKVYRVLQANHFRMIATASQFRLVIVLFVKFLGLTSSSLDY